MYLQLINISVNIIVKKFIKSSTFYEEIALQK
jgi:hypothetical protein